MPDAGAAGAAGLCRTRGYGAMGGAGFCLYRPARRAVAARHDRGHVRPAAADRNLCRRAGRLVRLIAHGTRARVARHRGGAGLPGGRDAVPWPCCHHRGRARPGRLVVGYRRGRRRHPAQHAAGVHQLSQQSDGRAAAAGPPGRLGRVVPAPRRVAAERRSLSSHGTRPGHPRAADRRSLRARHIDRRAVQDLRPSRPAPGLGRLRRQGHGRAHRRIPAVSVRVQRVPVRSAGQHRDQGGRPDHRPQPRHRAGQPAGG